MEEELKLEKSKSIDDAEFEDAMKFLKDEPIMDMGQATISITGNEEFILHLLDTFKKPKRKRGN